MMSEWQPIESAPKRTYPPGANISVGTPEIIVGWRGSKSIAFAYWEPGMDEAASWSQTGEGWWRVIGGPYPSPPTHWMPLPAPPEASEGSDR